MSDDKKPPKGVLDEIKAAQQELDRLLNIVSDNLKLTSNPVMVPKPDRFEEKALEIVAQGWCHPTTSHLVMDTTLATAIAERVAQALREEAAEPLPDDQLEYIRKTISPFKDGEPLMSLTKTVKAMADEIYEYRNAKTQLVSESELRKIAIEHYKDVDRICLEGPFLTSFETGFRKAMELRATEDIKAKWPSHDQVFQEIKNFSEDSRTVALYLCGWLKERLMK